jgi:hypothetical protein
MVQEAQGMVLLEGLECIGYDQFATSVLEIIQSTLIHQVINGISTVF